MARLVPMAILVPPYLSASLALLIHAFRTGRIAVAALVLVFILAIRLSASGFRPGVVDCVLPVPALLCILWCTARLPAEARRSAVQRAAAG